MGRSTVRVTLSCNNACLFCAQRGLPDLPSSESTVTDELKRLRAATDEVTFTGGEPTLWPGLPGAIAAARGLGFRAVGVQTNGRLLADPQFAKALVAAGLTDVHFSIHGAEAALHDYHVGAEGAFAQVIAALGQVRAMGLVTAVTTVLTRSNYRMIHKVPTFLRGAGVSAWLVTLPRIAGALLGDEDRITPRLGLAIPFALQAIDYSRKLGLPAWIQGAPICVLKMKDTQPSDWVLPEEPGRTYAPLCARCACQPGCPGVDATYLARFGPGELAIREAIAPAPLPALARLFVGVGELSPVAPAPAVTPPIEPAPVTAAPPLTALRVPAPAGDAT